ncbi:MAG: hypothetical protein ABW128_17000 [Rhizorhabdus sp.]
MTIKFTAHPLTNTIVCTRQQHSTVVYKQYGIHPDMSLLTSEQAADWLKAKREMGW